MKILNNLLLYTPFLNAIFAAIIFILTLLHRGLFSAAAKSLPDATKSRLDRIVATPDFPGFSAFVKEEPSAGPRERPPKLDLQDVRRDDLVKRLRAFLKALKQWAEIAQNPQQLTMDQLGQIHADLQALSSPPTPQAIDEAEADFQQLALRTIEPLVSTSDRDLDPHRANLSLQQSIDTLVTQAGLTFVAPREGEPVHRRYHHTASTQQADASHPRGTVARLLRRGLMRQPQDELLTPAQICEYD